MWLDVHGVQRGVYTKLVSNITKNIDQTRLLDCNISLITISFTVGVLRKRYSRVRGVTNHS